jgi:hypothetical protein
VLLPHLQLHETVYAGSLRGAGSRTERCGPLCTRPAHACGNPDTSPRFRFSRRVGGVQDLLERSDVALELLRSLSPRGLLAKTPDGLHERIPRYFIVARHDLHDVIHQCPDFRPSGFTASITLAFDGGPLIGLMRAANLSSQPAGIFHDLPEDLVGLVRAHQDPCAAMRTGEVMVTLYPTDAFLRRFAALTTKIGLDAVEQSLHKVASPGGDE